MGWDKSNQLVDAVRVCSLGQITNALFEVSGSTVATCSCTVTSDFWQYVRPRQAVLIGAARGTQNYL